MLDKARTQDNFFAYIVAAIVVALVVVFVIVWSQVRSNAPATPEVSYSKFGPYQIETQHFSITATLSVQTSQDDADWPNTNRKTLNTLFKKVFLETDAKVLRDPNGVQILQDALKKESEAEFHTHSVQAVYLTDFSFQTRDAAQ
jgi:flagellar basal body-associated protein FliL